MHSAGWLRFLGPPLLQLFVVGACGRPEAPEHGRDVASARAERRHELKHGNPADLEGYIARMDDPARAEWQRPDEVITTLAVRPGANACDIGAGTGYFSVRLATAVGDRGTVYAVDVEPRLLEVLRERVQESAVRNVVPVLGLTDDPLLPADLCDVVLIVNTLHHFSDPVAYLRRLRRSLKAGGRIVNIDFHRRKTPVGPPIQSRIDRADFVAIAERAGLRVAAEHHILPHQYFIELEPM